MSDFTFQIVGDATTANKAVDGVLDGLGKIPTAAKAADAAVRRATEAHNRLTAAAQPLAQGFARIAEAIKREHDMLERIHGPMRQHAADVQALNTLHARGAITAKEHAEQMRRIGSAPTTGKSPGLGATLAGGFAVAGGVAVVHELADISDRYTNLQNSALKFVDAGRDVTDVLDDQREIANRLHMSMEQTISVYDAVRDATDELNLTYDEQLRLTNSIGAISKLSNKSAESLADGMHNLKVAIETGQDPGRTLIALFKQFPDLADQMKRGLNMTSAEIVSMAKSGQLSYSAMTASLITDTAKLNSKMEQYVPTWSQKWDEFKDGLFKPLDIRPWLDSFDGVSMAIARIQKDADTFAKKWAEHERMMQGGNFGATYTATRDSGSVMAGGYAQEVVAARKAVDDTGRAYSQGLIPLHKYTEAQENLQRLLHGNTTAARNQANEIHKLSDALLAGESVTARAIRKGAADRAQQSAENSLLGELDSKGSFDALAKYQAQLAQLNDIESRVQATETEHAARVAVLRNEYLESIGVLDVLNPKQDETATIIEKVKEAYAAGAISAAQFAAAQAQIKKASADEHAKAEEERVRSLTKSWNDRLAEAREKTTAQAQLMADAFSPVRDALVEVATTGKMSFDSMFSSIEQRLAQLAADFLFQSLISGLTGAPNTSLITKAIGGGANGFDYRTNSNPLQLPGFATGGDFTVGGRGGTDANLIAFRATAGETVSVRTPQQQRQEASTRAAPAGPANVFIQMQNDHRDIVQGMDSMDGQRVVAKINRRIGGGNRRRY